MYTTCVDKVPVAHLTKCLSFSIQTRSGYERGQVKLQLIREQMTKLRKDASNSPRAVPAQPFRKVLTSMAAQNRLKIGLSVQKASQGSEHPGNKSVSLCSQCALMDVQQVSFDVIQQGVHIGKVLIKVLGCIRRGP